MKISNKRLGLLGGGQLGMYFSIAAKNMGYQITLLDPNESCPASKYSDLHITSDFNDQEGVNRLITNSDRVTLEFENVPIETMELIQNENVKCVPDINALKICQNRLLEKKFFESLGIETTLINETKDFNESNFKPLIFKTKSQGYDGKGQIRCNSYNEFNKVLEKIDLDNYIVEKYVDDLDQEVSVIVSVSNGIVSLVSLNLNFHRNGILCETYSLQISENKIYTELIELTKKISKKLNYSGVLCVEFFVTNDGKIIANEMAPRPHNSGHHTIDSAFYSQFDFQLFNLLGISKENYSFCSAGMLNILGQHYLSVEKNWGKLLGVTGIKKYLYGKLSSRKNRKMGHINVIGQNYKDVLEKIKLLKKILNYEY